MTATTAAALIGAAAILAAMVLTLSVGVRRVQSISGRILAPAGLCGLVFYTLAYLEGAQGAAGLLAAVLHSVYTTCLMFMGRNDYSSMLRTPWFAQSPPLQLLFWLVHLAALFVSASALLSTIGQKLLQTLRLRFARGKTVTLLFGLHEQSLYLGRDLRARGLVVYVDPKPAPGLSEQVLAFGGVVRQMSYARSQDGFEQLLRQLRIGGRRSCIALALDESEGVNLRVVGELVRCLAVRGVPPERARLCLRSQGELDYSQLAQFENAELRYSVDAFSDAELAARLLIQESPPYRAISFDEDGHAQEDFCALVIGFGQVGQHTLRQIVMNGQFVGSSFSAVVIDRNASQMSGQFARRYAGMMQQYDIRFVDADIRSHSFYEALDELAPRLKYIVVCLGADSANYEATADLERYFTRMDEADRPFILVSVCNKRYVATTRRNIRFFDRQEQVFSSRVLLRDQIDHMAMAVNYTYSQRMGGAQDIVRAWRGTGYFSRESSRASADFIPAMLSMARLEESQARDQELFAQRLRQNPALLDNLARAEHLRWNAFHFAMGYTTMAFEEVEERARRGITPLQKDPVSLRHACLVSWEQLQPLSALVARLTGDSQLDYQQLDSNNVHQIPRTLAVDQLLEESGVGSGGK